MYDLTGKVAVITGAASGMGHAAAVLFAQKGANVVLADLNVIGGEAAAAEASQAGPACVFQRADVAKEADVEALIARAVGEFGKLDILFNNAGIGGAVGPLEDIAVDDWDRTQAVCLRGVFLGIKHAIAPMRANGGGSIVSTASTAGIDGYSGLHAYCAAKAGVVNLTRSASLQLACDFIRVNAVAPGGVSTPIVWNGAANREAVEGFLLNAQPLPRVGRPLDIANAALFLASDAAQFITGHTLVVDGGATAGALNTAPKRGQATARGQRTFAGPSFEVG
ncbi:SDR family NAD(P)-dependent oxidoreductase [Phenylobacterium sp.]|uniref:SDR family NAD(P)-dependent oxidoreductase n=1 Tax=Phenylobacterium sp. TaxID=1871053 RepID=UPI002F40BC58